MRVGVIGGGQLARMMIPAAIELGVELRVLAEANGMSAALAADRVGDYTDVETVLSFAREVADSVCFLHDGLIVEHGDPDQIFTAPEQPETQRFLRRLLEAGRL